MQESGEMYLETILLLQKKNKVVRAIDVAEDMGFSKPSVSRALSILKGDDYIVVVSDMLTAIGVDRDTALADACRIEHVISDKTFSAIKKYIKEKQEE